MIKINRFNSPREESKLKLKDLDGRLNTITQEKLGLESELTIMKESLATFSAVSY